MRHERDKGMVSVLDPRIFTRRYGQRFLRNLPPDIPIVSSFEEAARRAEELGLVPDERKGRQRAPRSVVATVNTK